MPKTVDEITLIGPLLEHNLQSRIYFDIVAKSAIVSANPTVHIDSFTVPFISCHQSFIHIPVLEDKNGPSVALPIREISNIYLMRTQPYDF